MGLRREFKDFMTARSIDFLASHARECLVSSDQSARRF
jgi:hypothetical protein